MIGPEDSRHFLNQSDAKLKPITTWSPTFSRALDNLVGFPLSSHWLLRLFSFLLIDCWDYSGFGCTTLNRKALQVRRVFFFTVGFDYTVTSPGLQMNNLKQFFLELDENLPEPDAGQTSSQSCSMFTFFSTYFA